MRLASLEQDTPSAAFRSVRRMLRRLFARS
jgi:hypothetical protein